MVSSLDVLGEVSSALFPAHNDGVILTVWPKFRSSLRADNVASRVTCDGCIHPPSIGADFESWSEQCPELFGVPPMQNGTSKTNIEATANQVQRSSLNATGDNQHPCCNVNQLPVISTHAPIEKHGLFHTCPFRWKQCVPTEPMPTEIVQALWSIPQISNASSMRL